MMAQCTICLSLLSFVTVSGLSVGSAPDLSSGSKLPEPVCVVSDGPIQNAYQCDGSIDCPGGTDETPAACKEAKMQEYSDDQYWMLHPAGYTPPDPSEPQYKIFYDRYTPRLVDLPFAGKNTATVEVYLLDSPAFHDTVRYHGIAKWLLLEWTKLVDFLHFGVGFLMRDANGKELGRISMQYWSGFTEVMENPNVLTMDNKLNFDKDGNIHFDARAVTTYRKSRGSWEGGYWDRELLVKTLDAKTYDQKLKWLDTWIPEHMQFLSFGYVDKDDNLLQPRTSCVEFARLFIKELTDVDVWKLDFEWVRVAMTSAQVEVIAKDVPAKEVEPLMKRNNYTLATAFCGNCKEPNVILIAPAAYHADGTPDAQKTEFYNKVHILKPDGVAFGHDPSSGRVMQNRRWYLITKVVSLLIAAGAVYWVMSRWCRLDRRCDGRRERRGSKDSSFSAVSK